MSKALVIKGANFAANKVETITLTQPIPCTALSVSPTSKSFSALNETQQITITKTPADTTDTVTYSSSNENVATVSSSGLITCVGIGTAVITVTCGEQTATCEVALSALTIVLDDTYAMQNGVQYAEAINYSLNPPKDYISLYADNYGRVYYSDTEYGEYRVFTNGPGKYAIPLPKGATKVKINPPQGLQGRSAFVLANVNEQQTYVQGAEGLSALGIKHYINNWSATYPVTIDFSTYADQANGFIVSANAPSSAGIPASDISGKTTIEFS